MIHYSDDQQLRRLNQGLRFTPPKDFMKIYTQGGVAPSGDQEALAPGLAAKIDGLHYLVCQLLPACPQKQPLLQIFLLDNCRQVKQRYALFSTSGEGALSGPGCFGFFLTQVQAVFISLDDLRTGIMAHEMAHFIMSQYSPPPSVEVQEGWAHYVEGKID